MLTKYTYQCIRDFIKSLIKKNACNLDKSSSHSMSDYTEKMTCKEEVTETVFFEKIYNSLSTFIINIAQIAENVVFFAHLWFE